MAKFHGKVGYVFTEEITPGVWIEIPIEHLYYGDILRNVKKSENSGYLNNNINIANQISIVADPYANKNFRRIRYVEFMGALWNVTSVEVRCPRLLLTIGGVYNGEQARIARDSM